MSVANRNSGIHAGVTQAHEKCAMKIKERRKKQQPYKNILMTGRTLYGCIKSDITDFDEFRVNNSSHTKGTICLVNE